MKTIPFHIEEEEFYYEKRGGGSQVYFIEFHLKQPKYEIGMRKKGSLEKLKKKLPTKLIYMRILHRN